MLIIQTQVLNHILKDNDTSLVTLNNLTSDYFSDYPQEFSFIMEFYSKYGKAPDYETFMDNFPNFEVVDVKEPQSYLLEELVKDRNKRFLATNFNKIRELLMGEDIDGALSVLRQASEVSTQNISLQCVDLLEDTSRYDTYLDKIDNFDKYFIKTGFKELDNIICGWDVNEDLVTIVARNGKGKSWVLLKCAVAAAEQGKNVGIYSGEMSEDAVGYRVDTLIGHLSNGALLHGNGSVKNQYKTFLDNLKTKVPGHLKVITPKMINGPAGVSALRAFIEKEKLDVLFVDQHSLLQDDRKAKSPVEKAANISTDLKLLQTIKRIPIVCVSQQNREKTEAAGGFDTTQIAQADKIGQDSSIVIFLERQDDLLKLHLVKSRNTGDGKVLTYKIDLNTGQFIYIDENPTTTSNGDASVEYDGNYYSEDDVF